MRWILWIWALSAGLTQASEVLVSTQNGRDFIVETEPYETLEMLQDRIAAMTESDAFIVALPPGGHFPQMAKKKGGYLGYPRDYWAPLTPQEHSDICFVVNSLADESLFKIASLRKSLESAGDRIDHIHPLRFLMAIFTDERMKVAVRNIRKRGWIWPQFIEGLKESLFTESSIDNMSDEYVRDFAAVVALDPNKLLSPIHQKKWDQLLEILINEVPRKGEDYDRYDY